jgi:hypothetical protein
VLTAQVADRAHRAVEAIGAAARREAGAYSRSEQRPLLGYMGIAGAYSAAVAVGAIAVRRRGRHLPRMSARDIALIGCATFQLSHMLAKQPIASPLRAPFTVFDGVTGPSELHEEVRGDGLRHAVGELLTCPFCLAHWVATAFGFAFILAPEPTRLVAALLSAEVLANFVQLARTAVEQGVE